MRVIGLFTQRTMRLFFRDPAAILFALLSPTILFIVYAVFLGNSQAVQLRDNLPTATDSSINIFVTSWVFSGLVLITTVTAALGAYAVFVSDISNLCWRDILVSPIRRFQFVFSYILSSFLIAASLTFLVYFLGIIWIKIIGGEFPGVKNFFEALGYILLLSLVFSALSASAVVFLARTSSAYRGLSVIVGVLVGFLAAAYIPAGALTRTVMNFINALPFSQGAILLRGPIIQPVFEELDLDGQTRAILQQNYGVTGFIGNYQLPAWLMATILSSIFVVFSFLAYWRLHRSFR